MLNQEFNNKNLDIVMEEEFGDEDIEID